MKIFIPFLLFFAACAIPPAKTPTEISAWAKCDPANIAYWVGQHDYKVVKGWNTAEECMAMPAWDCKCSAVIARDTLKACGYEARVQTLKRGKKLHAVALYTDKKGNKGFIDSQIHKSYGRQDWEYVVDGVNGGPWTIVE